MRRLRRRVCFVPRARRTSKECATADDPIVSDLSRLPGRTAILEVNVGFDTHHMQSAKVHFMLLSESPRALWEFNRHQGRFSPSSRNTNTLPAGCATAFFKNSVSSSADEKFLSSSPCSTAQRPFSSCPAVAHTRFTLDWRIALLFSWIDNFPLESPGVDELSQGYHHEKARKHTSQLG